jgi:DNA-binding MarR family transcriptional regulator
MDTAADGTRRIRRAAADAEAGGAETAGGEAGGTAGLAPGGEARERGLPPDLLAHPVFVMLQLLRMVRQRGGPGAELAGRNAPRHSGTIRLPHYGVLSVLAYYGPSSQREVADRLHYDASDLVTIVDVLEADGFVARLRDTTDRRRYLLTITPDGQGALVRTLERSVASRADFLAPLSEAERVTLLEMLNRLYLHHDNLAK